MKTSAIIRIVVWSLVALFLLAILVTGLTRTWTVAWPWRVRGTNGSYHYSSYSSSDGGSSSSFMSGAAEIPAASIDRIEIAWVAGSVNVSVGGTDSISISESSYVNLSEEQTMRYKVSGDTLKIQFCKDVDLGFFDLVSHMNMPSKDLKVVIPASIASSLDKMTVDCVSANLNMTGISGEKFQIDSVSGSVDIDGTTTGKMETNTTSGAVELTNISIDELQTNTVSGRTNISGTVNKLNSNSVSGSLDFNDAICPERIEVGTVSGSTDIVIPENNGFDLEFDTASGSFNSGFSMSMSGRDHYIYKDGGANFDVGSVSGSLRIDIAK